MTTNPFAALLDGVPRREFVFNEDDQQHYMSYRDDGSFVLLSEVLAALSAAVPADLAEAGKVLEGVTPGPWCVGPVDDCRVEDANGNEVAQIDGDYNQPETWPLMEANARFIAWCREGVPALLARRAAQEAQMKGLEAESKNRIGDLMKLSQQMDEWKASQHYRYIGADGQPVLARDLEARAEAAETALAAERAKTARLVEEIKRLTEVIDSTADYLEENHQSQGKPYRWLRAAITEAGHE